MPSISSEDKNNDQHQTADSAQQPTKKPDDGLTPSSVLTGHTLEPQTSEKQNKCCNYKQWRADDSSSVWTKRYTFLTVIIVGIMIVQTYISQQSIVGVQRAFVSLNRLSLTRYKRFLTVTVNGKDNSVEWMIEPIWENTGSTPTRNLKIFNAAPIGRVLKPNTSLSDIEIDFSVKDEANRVPIFIAPKGQVSISVNLVSRDFLQALKDGTVEYFLWGEAIYDDVF